MSGLVRTLALPNTHWRSRTSGGVGVGVLTGLIKTALHRLPAACSRRALRLPLLVFAEPVLPSLGFGGELGQPGLLVLQVLLKFAQALGLPMRPPEVVAEEIGAVRQGSQFLIGRDGLLHFLGK